MEGLGVTSIPLLEAAHEGQLDIIQQLLQRGHSLNHVNSKGSTLLHIVAAEGHVECTKFLLDQEECNPRARTCEGFTTLYVACHFQNNPEIIRLLIDAGVDCNRGDDKNVTPLHIACMNFKYEIAEELIRQGANVNSQDFNLFTPLMSTIGKYSDGHKINGHRPVLDIVNLLLDHGANVSAIGKEGSTPLLLAVQSNWEDCVKLLIERGASVNARDNSATTSLMIASQRGNLPIVQHLLQQGANPFLRHCYSSTALHQALQNGHVRIAAEVLREMKDYDIKEDIPCRSFLFAAVCSGLLESVQFVIENKLTYPVVDREPLLLDKYYRPYEFQSPLTFLLSNYIDETYSIPIFDCLLQSDSCSVNAQTLDEVPPLCAIITSLPMQEDLEIFHRNEMIFFMKLLENGADIDYCSCENIHADLQIPDAVCEAVRDSVLLDRCTFNQTLVPVLAHCYSCDWNKLLEYLLKKHPCSAPVVVTLLSLVPNIPVSLSDMWESAQKCDCEICIGLFPKLEQMMRPRVKSLQCLSRSALRRWLWEMTYQSSKAVQLLKKLKIPKIIEDYVSLKRLVVRQDE